MLLLVMPADKICIISLACALPRIILLVYLSEIYPYSKGQMLSGGIAMCWTQMLYTTTADVWWSCGLGEKGV